MLVLLLPVGGAHTSFSQVQTSPRPTEEIISDDRPGLRLDPTKPLAEFMQSSWSDQEGLPATTVNALYQDEAGYIWIATQVGLVRFNGHRFKVYEPKSTPGLNHNEINHIVGARNEGMWVATNGGGVTRYRNGQFNALTEQDGLVSDQVEKLYLDPEGGLWVMTAQGISHLRNGRFTNYTTKDGLTKNRTHSAVQGPQGFLLVGTDSSLVRAVPGDSLHFEIDPRYPELEGKAIIDLLRDSRGGLWAATFEHGLFRFAAGETVHITPEQLHSIGVTSLYEDQEGAIWIGTYYGGVVRYYQDEFDRLSKNDGLPANRVDAIIQDREHSLWLGMHGGGGISQLRNSKFSGITEQHGLTGNSVASVSEGPDGMMWVATLNSGLNRVRDGRVHQITEENGLPTNALHAVLADRSGNIWIGGKDTGLCRRTTDGFECITEEDGLLHDNIFSLYEDSRGRIWVGNLQGVNLIDGNEIRSFTQQDGLSGMLPTAIHEDGDGTIWIGTLENGINRFENGSFTSYTKDGPLPSDQVITLTSDTSGQLWIGTGSGLCRHADGTFRCVGPEDGLFTNQIVQLETDDNGYLWMGSLSGLGRAKLADLNAFLDGRADTVRSEAFGYGDGLPSPEGQGGIQPSTWQRENGDLWFATIGGAAYFDPDRLPLNKVPPRPTIDRVFVSDEPTEIRDSVVFEPGTGKFDFHIGALTFVNNEGARIEYRLAGYDDGWVELGNNDRTVHYTNLSPGNYRFVVRAQNQDGVWSEGTASMTFTIEPFFYQTVWFYFLCAFGLVGGGYGAYKLRVRQIQKREEELSRLVDEQTQELQEREKELEELNESLEEEVERQLEVILEERERAERKRVQLEERKKYEEELIKAKEKAEESAKLKATILMNMSHEIRTPLTSILGFAEVLEEEIEGDHLQFAELIRKSGERLLDTLNSVLDMSQLEANSMSIEASEIDLVEKAEETIEMFEAQAEEHDLYLRLETNTDGDPVTAQLDESFIDRILDNLVGNALKFTEEGGVTIRVDNLEDTLRLEIEDTGVGISEEFLPQLFEAFKQESSGLRRSHEGTGLGLAITKRLVELMDGTIEVESEKGEGTTFIIEMPREVGSQEPDHDPLDREEAADGELADDDVLEEMRGGSPEEDTDEIKLGLDDDELSDLQRGNGSDSKTDSGGSNDAPGPHPDVVSHDQPESRS